MNKEPKDTLKVFLTPDKKCFQLITVIPEFDQQWGHLAQTIATGNNIKTHFGYKVL